MAGDYKIRSVEQQDAAIVARHRALMFLDMGTVSEQESEQLCSATEPWTMQLLSRGEYVGWFAVENTNVKDTNVIAGGGIYIRVLPPIPGSLKVGRWAYIANIYTVPAHRGRGIARRLMEEILQWCSRNDIDLVTLAASDQGRRLHESLGFVDTNDMSLPGPYPGR